jgi:hypothetical protein
MTYWDPEERLADDELNEWRVQQHLYAERRLRDIVERGFIRTQLFNEPQSDRCCRKGCGAREELRLIRLTGDVVCDRHDPLRTPGPARCCDADVPGLERCGERDGVWACGRLDGHGQDHRYSELGG